MSLNRLYLCLLIVLVQSFTTFAQEEAVGPEKVRSFELFEWGVSLSYGFVNEDIPEGNYGPFLLMGHLEFHAHRKKRNPDGKHFFLLYGEPQVNPVLIDGGIKEWEAGLNIGVKYLIRIKERNSLFIHGGSGPHYISLHSPEHQAGGFIFSDNVGIGYQRHFKRDLHIVVGYRYRHLSNLDIELPNMGLDNHFFTIGFKKDFEHRAQQRRERKHSSATIE